jgi:hypothetical protein
MRVAYLIGSGPSVGKGLPNVKALTKEVKSGNAYSRHSDGGNYPCRAYDITPVTAITRCLSLIKCAFVASGYQDENLDYEALYYIVDAVGSFELGYSVDPLVPFLMQ